jgi:hydroxyacylglutathione hydrolase
MNPFPTIYIFIRPFPSANTILIEDENPLLIDPGFGSHRDILALSAWLAERGISPRQLEGMRVVNTHYHTDHSGANHYLQKEYGAVIHAHTVEAEMANRADPDVGKRRWLDQPLENYRVDRELQDGDVIEAGETRLQVIHLPGHTQGMIGLYHAESGGIICGDVVHGNDVAWLNLFGEGSNALESAITSLETLAALPLKWGISGHSPLMTNPQAAIATAIRRYTAWRNDPEKIGWHACKRIFAYKLMLTDGMDEAEVTPYLVGCAWYQDYCRLLFKVETSEFIEPFIAELLRSKAAGWKGRRLMALMPYLAPDLSNC